MRAPLSVFVRFFPRAWFATCAAVLVFPLLGCGHLPGYPPPAVARPQDVLSFSVLYSQNCAACHGRDGQDGPAMNLANPEYEALVDDATLHKLISDGMPGTQMPSFAQSGDGMLTDAQIDSIVAGMRKRWFRPNAFAGATPPPYAQTHPGNAQRGGQIYQARCAICHGAAPGEITNPVYLALVSDQFLRSVIIAGSPDVGQPDWRHDSKDGKPAPPLSEDDVDNIVAYLAAIRNSAPAYAGNTANPQPAPAGGKP